MHMKCTFGMQTLKQSDRPADVAGHLGVSGAPTVQNNVDCASARGKAHSTVVAGSCEEAGRELVTELCALGTAESAAWRL
jgi:hypothetical protein